MRNKYVVVETLEPRRLLSATAWDEVTPLTDAPSDGGVASPASITVATSDAAEAAVFAHPSILHTEDDFTRMRQKVSAGAQPWAAGWNALASDGYSQAGWTPRPLATVIRGGAGQNFSQMVIDMQRAYQTAVRWKVSGNTLYADQAVQILNAWSATHTTLTGNADRFLASGLYGFGWAAAADIMRSYSGWAAADVTAFQNYLVNIYYPMQHQFLTNHNDAYITNYWANWDLANIEGMMAVGIFADRQDIYDEAINYLFTGKGNGALDKAFYYLHPGNLMQWQESGRDQGHTTLGMGLFGHIAQMAWNRGLDLFSYNNHQFLAAAEYIAKYNLGYDVPFQTYNWGNGQSGAWSTHTAVSNAGRGHGRLVFELIYNHYVQRLGMAAPYSTQRVLNLRPEWRGGGDEFGFGTLTYALDGLAAPQPPRGLTAAEKGAGNIQLDFFGGANVTHYNLYRSTSIDGTYALVATGITDLLTYTDRNLPPGDYYYKVTGVTGTTETPGSNIVSATSTHQPHTQLPLDENTGTTANDATGNGHNATLANGAFWTSGRTGSAIGLDGTNDYVSLPDGVVADVDDFTIAAWVQLASAATWSRIFDFGDDRGRWMMLTPRNGNGVVEFATSTVYGYNKQWVVGNSALPTGQWVHVAVTLADRVGTLYINGVAVGSNANIAFPPAQIRSTPRNWIGRSQFSSDPYLNGKVDDFRIDRGAMSPAELYALATGNPAPSPPAAPASLAATAVPGNTINLSWPAVAGATKYTIRRSTTSGGPYTTLATLYSGTSFSDINRTAGVTYYYIVSAYNNGGDGPNSPQASATALPPAPAAPANLVANAISSSAISLSWSAAANAATYAVKRSTSNGGPYTSIAGGLTTTTYIDTGRSAGTTYYYVVSAVNAAGESGNSNQDSATPTDLLAHLKFDEAAGTTAADAGGNGWNGTLANGALWSSGRAGNAVDLDGTDDHVTLPAGVVSGVTNATIATWVFLDAASNWTRIFDFGTGTTRNMFLTPQNGANGRVRFAITTSGGGGEQQITGTAPLPVGAWTHVAVTLSGSVGILYVNGVEVGRNSAMTLNPNALGSTNLNYIGRSQYPDPYLNGRVDDFRLYSRALAAGEIGALAGGNVPAAPSGLAATPGDGQVQLSWSAVAGASSYTVKRAAASGGPYTTIANNVAGTNRTDAGLSNGTTYYYIVTASNILGEGAASAEAAATPFATTFTGTAADDEFYLRRSGDWLLIWAAEGGGAGGAGGAGDGSGEPTYAIPFAAINKLRFEGLGGDDAITLDASAGSPLPAGGIDFDGGDGSDAVHLLGSASAEAFGFNAASIDFAGAALNHVSIESRTFAGGGGDDALTVAGGAVALGMTQTFASLSIAPGAMLDVGEYAVVVNYSSISPVGIWTGSEYDGLSGAIQAGRLTSSSGSDNFGTLGVAEARDALAITGSQTATFAGQTVDSTSVLVRLTFGGDANLDGRINIDDYGRIDGHVAQSGSVFGWFFGDFNLDGKINIDDYGIIDGNINQQDGNL